MQIGVCDTGVDHISGNTFIQLRDKAQREGSELLILLAFPRNNSKRRETLLEGDVISGGQVNNRPGGRSRFRRRGVIASLLALST